MSGLSSKRNKIDFIVVFFVFSILFILAMPMVSSILISSHKGSDPISGNSIMNTNELGPIKSESDSQTTAPIFVEADDEINLIPMSTRGRLKWKYPTAEGTYISTPSLVDLTNNGDLEVVFISEDDAVYALLGL